MQQWDDLEEIDLLGEEEAGEGEEEPYQAPQAGGSLSTVPLLQALVCVLAFIGLLYLRHTGHPAYGEIREQYRREAAQEMELPRWEGGTPIRSATPAPTESPAALPEAEAQRL